MVKSVEGGDEKTLKENMELVRSKSPAQLGAISSFSDIPVPDFKSMMPEKRYNPISCVVLY